MGRCTQVSQVCVQNLEQVQPKMREANVKNVKKGKPKERQSGTHRHSGNEIHNAHNYIHYIVAP